MRGSIFVVLCLLVHPLSTSADVTSVTVTSRDVVAGGHSFGASGSVREADRPHRVCARSGRSAQPPHRRPRTRAARRGWPRALLVRSVSCCARLIRRRATACCSSRSRIAAVDRCSARFNRDAPGNDPSTDADFGDGLLMRDGYTLVSIGWEFDVPAPLLRIDAPPAMLPAGSDDRDQRRCHANRRRPKRSSSMSPRAVRR